MANEELCAFVLKAQITNMYISNMFCTYIVTYDRTIRDILSLLYLDIEYLAQVSHEHSIPPSVSWKKGRRWLFHDLLHHSLVISTRGFRSRWDGWEIIEVPTPLFQRHSHSKSPGFEGLTAPKNYPRKSMPWKTLSRIIQLEKQTSSVDSSILRADMILFLLDWLAWIPKIHHLGMAD